MLRLLLVVCTTFLCGHIGHCQLKKFYTVKNDSSYDIIYFSLKATSATCFLKSSRNAEPLTIYGNPSFSEVNPTFHNWKESRSNYANLILEDYNQKGLSQALSYSMFDDDKTERNYWKIFLTDQKIYSLDFQYGIGDTFINLSNLSVSKLKIESGSANVNIEYNEGSINKCVMDTFYVKVDMGTLVVKKIYLSKAKNVITDIGFGTIVLDFGEGIKQKCNINASVGAGKLKIIIPQSDAPAIVYFKNSPLCNISMNEEFEEVDDNVFVNHSYSPNAENLLEFNIDVALGSIVFEYVK